MFEDFSWEAKGLRAPPSSLPPKTFEQRGSFTTVIGQQGMVAFPVPYASPPNFSHRNARPSNAPPAGNSVTVYSSDSRPTVMTTRPGDRTRIERATGLRAGRTWAAGRVATADMADMAGTSVGRATQSYSPVPG